MLVLPYGGFDSPRGSTGAGWLGPGPRRRMAGFAGAFRRSELVGLDVGDLDFNGAGLIVNIRRSKTDQEGQGRNPLWVHARHLPGARPGSLAGGPRRRRGAVVSGCQPARAAGRKPPHRAIGGPRH